jgi:hypothetical protein
MALTSCIELQPHTGPVLRALADGTYVFVRAPAPLSMVNLVECISNVVPGPGTLE